MPAVQQSSNSLNSASSSWSSSGFTSSFTSSNAVSSNTTSSSSSDAAVAGSSFGNSSSGWRSLGSMFTKQDCCNGRVMETLSPSSSSNRRSCQKKNITQRSQSHRHVLAVCVIYMPYSSSFTTARSRETAYRVVSCCFPVQSLTVAC